jgi:hypothetical protein
VIHHIDLSHWDQFVSLIINEGENLCEDFPMEGFFQIKFYGVKRFTIEYNYTSITSLDIEDTTEKLQEKKFFTPGHIKEFIKEKIGSKNYYCIKTSASGSYAPALEICFEDVIIAFLGEKWDEKNKKNE